MTKFYAFLQKIHFLQSRVQLQCVVDGQEGLCSAVGYLTAEKIVKKKIYLYFQRVCLANYVYVENTVITYCY